MSADEQKAAAEGTVETWARSADNPLGGWYGLRKGYRGRFAMYLPPLLEALGRAELEGKGVEFEGDILDTGVCHMAFFRDPDGNALMLHRRYAPND